MPLADTFSEIVDSLPDDWTDLELDLRIFDERRYVDAAVLLVACNAQPYSMHDWHWRILCAHTFGHAAAALFHHFVLRDDVLECMAPVITSDQPRREYLSGRLIRNQES